MNPNHKLLQLVAQFHSFNGKTVPEKWRSFHSILKSLRRSSYTHDDLNNFIGCIVPANSLEKSFRIQIMIEFKLFQPIMDELKNDNRLLIRKLMKTHKVFGEVFSNLDPQHFIKDIFPRLSYVAKLKILHGIYKNVTDEKLVDKYFLAVESEYGSRLAANLIAGCSANLIKIRMERFYTKLTNRELKLIIKRDKDFLWFYLPLIEKNDQNKVWSFLGSKILKRFAQMYPETFWKFNDKYKTHVRFGRRMTPKMFGHRIPSIQKNNYEFLDQFSKCKRLYRTAEKRGKLQELVASLLPATHQEFAQGNFYVRIEHFMKQFPPSRRYTVFNEAFKEKFGKDFLDFPEYCRWCMQIIPTQLRDPIINQFITQDENLIVFYDPSKSIPLIKEKLQHCADSNYRARLVGWMYTTSIINDNRETLVEVLDHIVNRYRNDVPTLKEVFTIMMNSSDVLKLDENCWDKIYEIYQLLDQSKQRHLSESFYSQFFGHLIDYGRPLEEHCNRRLQELLPTYTQAQFRVFQSYILQKYEKVYLTEIGKYIPLYKDHDNYATICLSYLFYLVHFNTYNGKINPINLNNYNDFFLHIKTTDCFPSQSVIRYCLQHYPSDEMWHDLFWKQVKVFRNNIDLSTYLRRYPQKVMENLDRVLNDLPLYGVKIFLRQARRSLDRNSLQRCKEHALDLLSGNKYEDVKLAVTILSMIAPEALLYPTRTLIANTANERCSQDEFTRKKLMIKQLHRLGNLKDILTLILNCCNTGSCIRYASIPLWCICYNTPEKYIKEELVKFADGPISARKTVLILSKFLFKSHDFAKILQTFAQNENNPSMKHIIFEKTLGYLQENPSEAFWDTFETCVSSMDKNNRDMYESLMETSKIPREYLPKYIPMVFEQMSCNPFREIQKKRFEFLEVIPNEIIDSLDMGFLKSIIKETACLETVSNFHWKSVFFTDQVKRNELLETNFKVLDKFIRKNQLNLNRSGKVRNTVKNFISKFVKMCLELRDGNLIEKFMVSWNSIGVSDTFYQSYLTVRFTDVYFKNDFDPYKMGVEIKKMLNDYVNEIGISAIALFSDGLNNFLATIEIKDRNKVFNMAQALLEDSPDQNVYVLIMNLLRKNPPPINDQSEYGGVLKAVMKSEVPTVKFHLDSYFGYDDILNVYGNDIFL